MREHSFSQKLYNCQNPAERPAESARASGRFSFCCFSPLSGASRQLPHGGSQVTIVNSGKLGGKAELQESLPHHCLPDTYGRTLGSPCGGTNSDRVLRTKQGAVSGAALRFLQRYLYFCKNRLSARGAGETPVRAARLRGVPRPEHSVKNRNIMHKDTYNDEHKSKYTLAPPARSKEKKAKTKK